MFLTDPGGNRLEFKAFQDMRRVWGAFSVSLHLLKDMRSRLQEIGGRPSGLRLWNMGEGCL